MNDEVSRVLSDDTHVLIAGITGTGREYGGKSVTANWWFERSVQQGHHDWGLFYNAKGDTFVKGAQASSIPGAAELMENGHNTINYVPEARDPEAIEAEHNRLMTFLDNLSGSKIVVHDEAPWYDGDSLWWATAQGGNAADMRCIVLGQRPWDLSESVLANCPVKCWVGPLTTEGRRYLKVMGMAAAADDIEANTGKHKVNVTVGGAYVGTFGPVDGDYA